MNIHNFGAGPAALPSEVYSKTAEAINNFNDSGLSIMEISHRSKMFTSIIEEANQIIKKLMNLDENHEVLFLQGGASLQFLMVPFNLLRESSKAAYIDSGSWASAAIKEAEKIGSIEIVASSKKDNYNHIPKNYNIPENIDYFHCTSNNTIFGTQMKSFPKIEAPIIADMSSDIFSRELNFNDFGLIYAGAQKNCGIAGLSIVIVDKRILGKNNRNIPTYLNYLVHIEKGSMFNTPPVTAIYTSLLVFQWLERLGGIKKMEEINKIKAQLLYQEIDRNPLFKGVASEEDRSLMNACFVLNQKDEQVEKIFSDLCKESGIIGINGHRSVGGYRVSLYNAVTIESVKVLINVMQELEKRV